MNTTIKYLFPEKQVLNVAIIEISDVQIQIIIGTAKSKVL